MSRQNLDIEAYLDGRLSPEEIQEFTARLQSEPGLSAELERQRVMREDIRYAYAVHAVKNAALLRRRKKWMSRWLILCLLALVPAGIWLWKNTDHLPAPSPDIAPQSAPNDSKILPETAPRTTPSATEKTNRPIADAPPKSRSDDQNGIVLRDLPEAGVSDVDKIFFEKQFANYTSAIPATGIWRDAVSAINLRQTAKLDSALPLLPLDNDTTRYLQAVAHLMQMHPSRAEATLYPAVSHPQWKNEARYLMVWAYVLQGKTQEAQAGLSVLPANYRDTEAVRQYLKQN